MACDDFTHDNPFRALQSKNFPQKRRGVGQTVIRKTQKTTATSEEDESALFLNAVESLHGCHKGSRPLSSWSLEDAGIDFSAAVNASSNEKRQEKCNQRTACALHEDPVAGPQARDENHAEHAKAGSACTASQSSGMADSEPSGMPVGDDDAVEFLDRMGDVTPLAVKGRSVLPPRRSAPSSPEVHDDMASLMEKKLEFSVSFTDEYFEGHIVGLDMMTIEKLRSGQYSPEAHLDLHGLNSVQAFEALRGFMRSCWFKSLRSVLVIPGRGNNSLNGRGILRNKLQAWLTQEPFKRVVLAFCSAQPSDGGAGGVYVLLRKYRKKGKIYWERMPMDADLYD
ncbi:MAG: Smr/MutS family protein [Desulfovibrio sp.]|nr:Smr/MutS family protein [Desulfovibrio sp.]